MSKLFLSAVLLAAVMLASTALGQYQTVIMGNDIAADGGRLRKVQVDSQGRLMVSPTQADGGAAVQPVQFKCSGTRNVSMAVGTSALAVPFDGGLANRWYVRVCNSPKNLGLITLTCTDDGQVPTTATTSPGDDLQPGDCATYATTTTIQCISDTANTTVKTEECN